MPNKSTFVVWRHISLEMNLGAIYNPNKFFLDTVVWNCFK